MEIQQHQRGQSARVSPALLAVICGMVVLFHVALPGQGLESQAGLAAERNPELEPIGAMVQRVAPAERRAYSVQLGAFRQPARAVEARLEWDRAGYRPLYIRMSDDQQWQLLHFGAFDSHAEARLHAEHLREVGRVDAALVRHATMREAAIQHAQRDAAPQLPMLFGFDERPLHPETAIVLYEREGLMAGRGLAPLAMSRMADPAMSRLVSEAMDESRHERMSTMIRDKDYVRAYQMWFEPHVPGYLERARTAPTDAERLQAAWDYARALDVMSNRLEALRCLYELQRVAPSEDDRAATSLLIVALTLELAESGIGTHEDARVVARRELRRMPARAIRFERVPSTIEQLVAKSYMLEGRLDEAGRHYDAWLRTHARNPARRVHSAIALAWRSNLHERAGDRQAAMHSMEQIFTLGLGENDTMPGDAHGEVWAAESLARVASDMGDPDMSYIWTQYHREVMPHQLGVQRDRAAPVVRNPTRILQHPTAEELQEK